MLGGMLPLEIASGILIAVVILWIGRFALLSWGKGDRLMAFLCGVMFAQIGGGLILAGLGLVPW